MSWINNEQNHYNIRQTEYNTSICLNKETLNDIVGDFGTIFDFLADFTDEIASIQVYPFPVKYLENFVDGEPAYGKLITSKGTWEWKDVYYIDPNSRYMNFGQYQVIPYFNNFADYKGYTQIKCFLPFIGFVDIDVNECMGKWLQFRLVVDYYSGKGLFIVGVTNNALDFSSFADKNYPTSSEDADIRIISTFECDLGIEIPLGSSNIGDIKRNLLLGSVKVAAGVAMSVATMNPTPVVSTTTTTIQPTVKTYDIKGSKGKQLRSGTVSTHGGSKTTETVHHKPLNMAKPFAEAFDGGIDVLNRGSANGNTDRVNDSGLMWETSTNVQVVIYRPKFVTLDSNYGALYGYPLGDTYELGNLSGYTEINAIHIEGEGFETITNKEVALLEEVFANGIIL